MFYWAVSPDLDASFVVRRAEIYSHDHRVFIRFIICLKFSHMPSLIC